MRNKFLVLEEKNKINGRKIEKEVNKIEELKELVKKQEEKKSEDQLVEILRNQFKKKTHELDQDLERKLYKDLYEK